MGLLQTAIIQRQTFMGEKKLYANIVHYGNIGNEQLIRMMQQNSGVTRTQALNAIEGVRSCVDNFLLNGHTICIPGLGRLSLTFRTKSQASEEDVTADTIKKVHIRFSPSAQVREGVKSVRFLGIVQPEDTLDVEIDSKAQETLKP